ncbi:hypothetical protein [Candidatus Pseudoruminococcus sp.]|uniref:hypothetical protein n=1 Tax=Candidatus Pseudoruminococcus sp. TaxID=3101048 RepID=UPI00399952EC
MEIKNVITVDNLTTESVSVKTQRVLIEDNGTETTLGLPSRKAYANSNDGRTELAAEVPEPYFSGIIAVWGDEIEEKE